MMKKQWLPLVWLLLVTVLLGVFSACGEEKTPEAPETPGKNGLVLAENGETAFTVVRSENAGADVIAILKTLRSTLQTVTGADFSVQDDWMEGRPENVENDAYEILLGPTNRKESTLAKEAMGDATYQIRVIGKKLVILAVSDYFIGEAVNTVLAWPTEHPDWFSGQTVTIPEDFVCSCKAPIDDQLSTLISTGTKFHVELEDKFVAAKDGDYKSAQGAASDGEFAYFMLRESADGYAIVVKYNLETGKYAGRSSPVYVLHANDMTYCPDTNLLYLVHGSNEGKIVTTMDADTLKVVEQTVNLPVGAGAMTCSWETGRFACSQGGKSFNILDQDLNLIKSVSKSYTSGYTAQGMGSDEVYCYFPMSGSEDNILMVYSWNGQYITDVHLPITYESETMFWVNGKYYVSFNKGGARLYELHFVVDE